jgi:outer membrane protein
MKTTLLLFSLCLVITLGCQAADGQRIATVDLRRVFDNYWRTKHADAKLKEEAADLERDRKMMIDQIQAGEAEYKKLLDQADDPALSAPERDKRKNESENRLLGLRDLEARIKQFEATSRATLGEKQRRMRDSILAEIRERIKGRIKSASYTLVLDVAAETPNGTPIVLFTAGHDDLTDAVLTELNINAPPASPATAENKQIEPK